MIMIRWLRRSSSGGTALIEMIVLGFGVLVVTLPIMLTVVRMAEASDIASDEARSVAVWYARHGQVPDGDRRSTIDVSVVDGVVSVLSSVDVKIVAIGGSSVSTKVSASFAMPISPYRSGR